jgi:hypothetical protein
MRVNATHSLGRYPYSSILIHFTLWLRIEQLHISNFGAPLTGQKAALKGPEP